MIGISMCVFKSYHWFQESNQQIKVIAPSQIIRNAFGFINYIHMMGTSQINGWWWWVPLTLIEWPEAIHGPHEPLGFFLILCIHFQWQPASSQWSGPSIHWHVIYSVKSHLAGIEGASLPQPIPRLRNDYVTRSRDRAGRVGHLHYLSWHVLMGKRKKNWSIILRSSKWASTLQWMTVLLGWGFTFAFKTALLSLIWMGSLTIHRRPRSNNGNT